MVFRRRLRKESPFERMLIHAVLILACVIALYPALRVLTVSLRAGNRLLSTTLELIPSDASNEISGMIYGVSGVSKLALTKPHSGFRSSPKNYRKQQAWRTEFLTKAQGY